MTFFDSPYKCFGLIGLVFWPWIPRYTDTLWAIDGPTAVTWNMMIGMPLALMAILAGVYLPIRRRRFGLSIFMLWFFALFVVVCQKILVTSAVGMQDIFIDQMQDAVERGYVLDRPEGVNALPKSRPLVYRVNHGVRWPIFYQKISEQQARIYHSWVWGQKVGGVIDVERGLLSLE